MEPLLQTIHECLASTDWATRKAAADALSALAMHSSNLVTDVASSTLTVLESCRFDKVASQDFSLLHNYGIFIVFVFLEIFSFDISLMFWHTIM